MKASAIAHSNIALIKYWGRSLDCDINLNIPSSDSIGMTKLGLTTKIKLQTHTTIEFSNRFKEDMAIFEGEAMTGRGLERVLRVVNPLREIANINHKLKMVSRNDFPTQAGLASSSSAFAALAMATTKALSLDFSKEKISTYARLGSGSAARSIHGGFVYWNKGNSHKTSFAEQICGPNEFQMNVVISIVYEGKKEVTSDIGHNSSYTSPFNEIRIKKSQKQAKTLREAILNDDFSKVGEIAEQNCKYMHAVMMTSIPPLYYWRPETLRLIKSTQEIRQEGLQCYFTIDAGPNVHFLCRPEDTYELQKILEDTKCVKETIPAKPAGDSQVTKEHLF